MRKIWIVDLIFFILMTSALVYSIITKNDMGICVTVVWSVYYLCKFIYDLVELRTRPKRLEKEAKEKLKYLFGNKGE